MTVVIATAIIVITTIGIVSAQQFTRRYSLRLLEGGVSEQYHVDTDDDSTKFDNSMFNCQISADILSAFYNPQSVTSTMPLPEEDRCNLANIVSVWPTRDETMPPVDEPSNANNDYMFSGLSGNPNFILEDSLIMITSSTGRSFRCSVGKGSYG
jgi:hypothetical protein